MGTSLPSTALQMSTCTLRSVQQPNRAQETPAVVKFPENGEQMLLDSSVASAGITVMFLMTLIFTQKSRESVTVQ